MNKLEYLAAQNIIINILHYLQKLFWKPIYNT